MPDEFETQPYITTVTLALLPRKRSLRKRVLLTGGAFSTGEHFENGAQFRKRWYYGNIFLHEFSSTTIPNKLLLLRF